MKKLMILLLCCISGIAIHAMQNRPAMIDRLEKIKEDLLFTPLSGVVSQIDEVIDALNAVNSEQSLIKLQQAQQLLGEVSQRLAREVDISFPEERSALESIRNMHRQLQSLSKSYSKRPRSPQHPLRESYSPSLEEQEETLK